MIVMGIEKNSIDDLILRIYKVVVMNTSWTCIKKHYLKKFLPKIIWWFSMISTIFTFRNIHILLKNFVQNVYKVFYFSKLLYSNPLDNVIFFNVYSHNVMFHFDSKKFLPYDFSPTLDFSKIIRLRYM